MAQKKQKTEKPVVAYVLIYRDEAAEWRWSARAANAKKVADSGEGYRNRGFAVRMARRNYPGTPLSFET